MKAVSGVLWAIAALTIFAVLGAAGAMREVSGDTCVWNGEIYSCSQIRAVQAAIFLLGGGVAVLAGVLWNKVCSSANDRFISNAIDLSPR